MRKWLNKNGLGILVILVIFLVSVCFAKFLAPRLILLGDTNNTTTVVIEPNEPILAEKLDVIVEPNTPQEPNFTDIIQQTKKEIKRMSIDSYERDVDILEEIRELKENNEPNFTDIVAQSAKSVVHVRCPQWQGSGFIIDKHIICTARHVVEDVEDFEITFNCGKKAHATRAVSDKEHDVGFIWIEEDMNDVVEIGSIKDCKLGQDIFIIGSPYGDINFNSVSKGIISGLNRDWDMVDPWTGEPYGWEIAFTSDSAAHPGNSGGAIFTLDGVVRGVLVGGYSPVLNCAMPCDLFIPDIEQIRLMFIMDKYEFEEAPVHTNPYYNYTENTEYYEVK